MASHPLSAKAIVTYPAEGPSPNWKVEQIKVREPKDDEVLVRMVATGICHTDLAISFLPAELFKYPRVLGHEGAGVVEKAGKDIQHVRPGDFVSLSYGTCKNCHNCNEGLSPCGNFNDVNIVGFPGFFKTEGDVDATGRFFGQSSFSELALAHGQSVINVSSLVKDREELKKLAPFGCGFLTGFGAVTEVANVQERDSIAVFGLGGVGLLAIMAAKLKGCKTIIGVDRVESRLELAKRAGATHVINTSGFTDLKTDLAKAIMEATNSWGTSFNFDTTGVEGIMQAGIGSLAQGGQLILIGINQVQTTVDMGNVLNKGIAIRGCIMGSTTPSKHIPQLIQWYKEGKLPVDELIKEYSVDDFPKALGDMHSGATVKPVLIW